MTKVSPFLLLFSCRYWIFGLLMLLNVANSGTVDAATQRTPPLEKEAVAKPEKSGFSWQHTYKKEVGRPKGFEGVAAILIFLAILYALVLLGSVVGGIIFLAGGFLLEGLLMLGVGVLAVAFLASTESSHDWIPGLIFGLWIGLMVGLGILLLAGGFLLIGVLLLAPVGLVGLLVLLALILNW